MTIDVKHLKKHTYKTGKDKAIRREKHQRAHKICSLLNRAQMQMLENLISLLAVPRRLFCIGSLVILDVARCNLWLFSLYINIKIGKNSC